MDNTPEPVDRELREQLRLIVTRNGKTVRIPEILEAELDDLEALIAQKQREARLTDNHDWDAEAFEKQGVIVCVRCATTYQSRGNKRCKGKMAKVELREAELNITKEENTDASSK